MTPEQKMFLDAAIPAAQLSQERFGVPASITIAQAILESGWGKSGLAVKANNYFGVKAVQGHDYMDFRTTEYVHGVPEHVMAHFAKYGSMAESFTAHAWLLSSLPRYAPAMAHRDDPRAFAEAIKAGGYSTAPDYADELMGLVIQWRLAQYDKPSVPPQTGAIFAGTAIQ